MELVAALLTALVGLFSPAGALPEVALEAAIEDQIHSAEALAVRIDNRPSYNLLSGRVDRVRIAGRGVYLTPELRVALVDIETDAVDLAAGPLLQGRVRLEQPLQFVARIVIDTEDVNQALRSPGIAQAVQNIGIGALGSAAGGMQQADLVDPRLDLAAGNQFRLRGMLREQGTDNELDLEAAFGLSLENGAQLSIEDPRLVADGVEFPAELLLPLIQGVNQQLGLRSLEPAGITARLLTLETTPDTLEAIAFVRLEPSVFP